MPKESSRSAVEQHLTGKETEPWELISFRLYKSQPPVLERALEVAGMTLGTDKSRGYCLEMNCADFLAGLTSLARNPKPRGFNDSSVETAADQLNSQAYVLLRNQVLERHSWRCQECGSFEIYKFII